MKPIDTKTFRHLLSVHGADLSRWPDVDVKEVLAFIKDNEEAAAAFAQASALDEALALYTVPDMPGERLMARIDEARDMKAESVPPHIAALSDAMSRTLIWRAGMAFAACAVVMAVAVTMWQPPSAVTGAGSAVQAGTKTAAATNNINKDIDNLLVIAAKGYQEQAQMQDLMSVLDKGQTASATGIGADENIDDAVNNLLEQEFNTMEGQDFWQGFATDNG